MQDLQRFQAQLLSEKVDMTRARLMEWYVHNNNKCYVSFSGGKDSTVLAYIAAQVCSVLKCDLILWFSDTGLEFPELKKHVKSFVEYLRRTYTDIHIELVIDYPKDKNGKRISFRDVILDVGYPIISKEVAQKVEFARSKPDGYCAEAFDPDSDYCKKYPKNCLKRWRGLLEAPFKISSKCCDIMKKKPAKAFEKMYCLKPILATMACESSLRRNDWLKNGCNAFNRGQRPISKPMSFWLEQDVLEFIHINNIPIATCYGDIIEKDGMLTTTLYKRTGCMYCMFGVHRELQPNRFQILKDTHPAIWDYCMKPVEEGGLGLRDILEYIWVNSE